jgi:hypothetical protein
VVSVNTLKAYRGIRDIVNTLKAYRGIRDITPLILILGAKWSGEVNLTSRPL